MSHYSIQAAAQISGISDACIRAWEKRYKSVIPMRNESNHRIYSDADIERLTLFNKLTSIGMRISQLSALDTEELKRTYLSITKKTFSDVEVSIKKSSVTFFQSLYIIEESFNAQRFDVAYHELKKVIEVSDVKDLALKFFPSLEGMSNGWKEKRLIAPDQIDAFERYLSHLSGQKSHRERQAMRDVRSVSVSFERGNNRIPDSGLEMLLTSHRVDHSLYSNEKSSEFLLTLMKVTKPSFVFLVAPHGHPEVMRILETMTPQDTTQVIVYDQTLPLLKNKIKETQNHRVFNSIFEIDVFLENTLQS